MKLSDTATGDTVIIRKVRGIGAFKKRITEMGFIPGKSVKVIKNAPLLDPIEYTVMGYNISLRRKEAELISVMNLNRLKNENSNFGFGHKFNGTLSEEFKNGERSGKCKKINIAFVGNPNCGKTTLFNNISGAKEKVGNYGGVTVDVKKAEIRYKDYILRLSDLPGTYSLTAYTPEELYVRKHITNELPDVIINVIDSSNLERNLYLTTQLIDMDMRVIIALNMFDELKNLGDKFDYLNFGKLLGIPIVPTVGSKGIGKTNLLDKIIDTFENNAPLVRHIHINYGELIEASIKTLREEIRSDKSNLGFIDRMSSRFVAIKLLEQDSDIKKEVKNNCNNCDNLLKKAKIETNLLNKEFDDDVESIITDAKYGFIAGALKETYRKNPMKRRVRTENIDNFVTHKFWGFPIFIFFVWLMFKVTFTVGDYPMGWLESLVGILADSVTNLMGAGPLRDLIVDGIINGVGGVIVFLPNIMILFLFISFLEDTGYMSRAVFIMDRLMHKIGLHGKSFIPMIMGFGCSVPAIMATRTIQSRRNRLTTMLVIPFMSCGAKIPVYILFISAFFPTHKSSMMMLLYGIGVVIAILAALVLRKTLFKGEDTPFVMELPPYRMPTTKTTLIHMWDKASQYLKKMGGVILVASILIWALGYFPRGFDRSAGFNGKIAKINDGFMSRINSTTDLKLQKEIKEKHIVIVDRLFEEERFENSYISKIGKLIVPVLRPLGFDWKMSVAIITGFAAKEVVVSTMGVLYRGNNEEILSTKIRNERYISGENKGELFFTPLKAFSFMLFILLYIPCIAAVTAIKKESNLKWAGFAVVLTTSIAWILSFVVYNVGSLFV